MSRCLTLLVAVFYEPPHDVKGLAQEQSHIIGCRRSPASSQARSDCVQQVQDPTDSFAI